MSFCEFCGIKIDNLPFRCKYCGGNYCVKHRLPENHDCSFARNIRPIAPKILRKPYVRDYSASYNSATDYEWKQIKRRNRQYNRLRRKRLEVPDFPEKSLITSLLIIIITVLSFIFILFPRELSFSISILSSIPYSFISILVSPFITSSSIIIFDFYCITDYVGLAFTIIIVFIFNAILKRADKVFGKKTFIGIFLFSVLLSAVFYILLRYSITDQYPIGGIVICTGFATSGIIGIISYTILVFPDKSYTIIHPIKINGRFLLAFILIFKIILWLITSFSYFPFIVLNLPDLAGFLVGFLFFLITYKSVRGISED